MAVTTLDPTTALIVVDLQKGIVAMAEGSPIDAVIARAAALAEAFRSRGLPVVLVTVAGGAPGRTEQARPRGPFPPEFTDLLPELNPQPSDHRVVKHTWGAFTGTGLADHLKQVGATQVVITGVATSIGVESTARQAYELGFNVTLATDAMLDLRPEAHAASVAHIFPRLGETGTAEEIIGLLDPRSDR